MQKVGVRPPVGQEPLRLGLQQPKIQDRLHNIFITPRRAGSLFKAGSGGASAPGVR
jgi:hypothetical protein